MFLKTQAFFDNHIPEVNALLIRAETALPAEYLRLYRKNVVSLTPMKTGALRRSIITRQLGNKAEIGWRAPYAGAQNQGSFTARRSYVANISGNRNRRGPYIRIHAGQTYPFRNYTTSGTGPHFANIAFQATNAQMPAVLRELGLTQ